MELLCFFVKRGNRLLQKTLRPSSGFRVPSCSPGRTRRSPAQVSRAEQILDVFRVHFRPANPALLMAHSRGACHGQWQCGRRGRAQPGLPAPPSNTDKDLRWTEGLMTPFRGFWKRHHRNSVTPRHVAGRRVECFRVAHRLIQWLALS